MLRILAANEISKRPTLSRTMFQDRAAQFAGRLGWDVTVGANGQEKDEYDRLNPIYVIWENPDGRHGGSMRFLPTMGRTMISEHFGHLVANHTIRHPDIWECTRFCLGDRAAPQVAPALMVGGLEFGLSMGLSHAIGVFDTRMERIYSRLGWRPKILGTSGVGREKVSAGLWAFDPKLRGGLRQRSRPAEPAL